MGYQLKKDGVGGWDVYSSCRIIGHVKKVNQNPAYGRGSGPVSADVMAWGAFLPDSQRIGVDFRTRRAAAEEVLRRVSG